MKKTSSTTKSSGKMTRGDSIVFFGSGPVAAESLQRLANDFTIEAVITKPQPEHHKETFPVLAVAQEFALQTLTVTDKTALSGLFASKPVKSRVGVVIDFGIIMRKDVIDYFPLGIVNSHFSLLPEWRGADPIAFAILSGQAETGVSLMLIDEKLDEGPLLAQKPHSIQSDTTTPQLTRELIELSHELLTEVLPGYLSGAIRPYAQDLSRPPTYSRKLTKQDGIIDWSKPAEQIDREIRAFLEWPKSRTAIANKDVIITKARAERNKEYGIRNTGEAFITPDKQLAVATGAGVLLIERLKPAGKREMSASEFLAGYKL